MNTRRNKRAAGSKEVEYKRHRPFAKWRSILAVGVAVILVTSAGARQSSKATAANSQNGKAVYEKLGCRQCHGAQGEGVSGAGSNAGVPRIASTSLSFADFLQQVRKPKGQMPPFSNKKVSDTDLNDVHAYLQSLKPVSEQPANMASASKGEPLYKDYGCYECHGFQGQGSVSTGGARLGPPRIPLSAFVSYIRQPTGEMPPYTAKVVSDEDASEIYHFLKSIPPPPPLKSIPLLNQ
jgi:mono/diheme cytochrome c family protein